MPDKPSLKAGFIEYTIPDKPVAEVSFDTGRRRGAEGTTRGEDEMTAQATALTPYIRGNSAYETL